MPWEIYVTRRPIHVDEGTLVSEVADRERVRLNARRTAAAVAMYGYWHPTRADVYVPPAVIVSIELRPQREGGLLRERPPHG